jgi:nucleoside triphosphate pyrophosphatase
VPAPVVVLASASPRRRELLRELLADFVVTPSAVDEVLPPGPYREAVPALALVKASAVAGRAPGAVVVGADTVVVADGEALGKPAGAEEARAMLRRLRGRPHAVITGVAVLDTRSGRAETAAAVSQVRMADYGDDVIEAYVASGAPFDKAGGYAIQDLDGALVAGLVGSYSNVVGLPLGPTRRLLEAVGIAVTAPRAR